MSWCGIEDGANAVIVGARGGIGEAFVDAMARSGSFTRIIALTTDPGWAAAAATHECVTRMQADLLDVASLESVAALLGDAEEPTRFVMNCSGILHRGALRPERTWRELELEQMRKVFDLNTLGVALLIKHMIPVMPRKGRSIFASLSARVGSIGDNRLGGWYSYRASKAAQNQIIKTAAIEAARRYPDLVLTALHPGTVDSELSSPFTKRLPATHKVFTPTYSCERLQSVLSNLEPSHSGGHFAWDGAAIPW